MDGDQICGIFVLGTVLLPYLLVRLIQQLWLATHDMRMAELDRRFPDEPEKSDNVEAKPR